MANDWSIGELGSRLTSTDTPLPALLPTRTLHQLRSGKSGIWGRLVELERLVALAGLVKLAGLGRLVALARLVELAGLGDQSWFLVPGSLLPKPSF